MTASTAEQKLLDQKAELRRRALERRASAHALHRATGGESIARAGSALILAIPGPVVSAYLPMRDEIDVLPLIRRLVHAGRTIALPVIAAKGEPLLFRPWAPGQPLEKKPFGLSEPPAAVAPVLPDILLVPLAAFDSDGFRLGYGGGYYDRTLALYRGQRSVTAIGVAYDEQEADRVPRGAHDEPLDWMLTPSGARRIGR